MSEESKIEVHSKCIFSYVSRKAKLMPASLWSWIDFGVLIICWCAFLLVWGIGAIYNAINAPATQKRAGRWFFSWGMGAIFVWVVLLLVPHAVWKSVTVDIFWLRLVGLILLLASTAFTFWARYTLGLMWTSAPVIKSEHVLHTDGPYQVTRHPIYSGLLGMLIGSLLVAGGGEWIAGVVVALIFFEVKIALEERLLLSTFGEQYVQFKQQVPQLIPFMRWKHF